MLYQLTDNVRPDKEFLEALRTRDFAEISSLYRLISNDTVRVLVPYELDVFEKLNAEQLQDEGIDSIREWVAGATPLSVSVQRSKGLNSTGLQPVFFRRNAEQDRPDWFVLREVDNYAKDVGLLDLESHWIC